MTHIHLELFRVHFVNVPSQWETTLQCNLPGCNELISFQCLKLHTGQANFCYCTKKRDPRIFRDYFVYVPNQWETTLHCNVISHWLGAFINDPWYYWYQHMGKCGSVSYLMPCRTFQYMYQTGIILCMCTANERQRYIVMASLIGWADTKWSLYHIRHLLAILNWQRWCLEFTNDSNFTGTSATLLLSCMPNFKVIWTFQ